MGWNHICNLMWRLMWRLWNLINTWAYSWIIGWTGHQILTHFTRQGSLYFLRRLGSFNNYRKLLLMFYQTVVTSAFFCAVLCRGGNSKKRNSAHLDKVMRRAGSVMVTVVTAERRTLGKFAFILYNIHHSLHNVFTKQRTVFVVFVAHLLPHW